MSNKKVRAGHHGFLKKVLEDVDECFENVFATVRKSELQKWKANLKEQLHKILPLAEEILAELAADEKADEIERSGRLKADTTQRLAEIDELAELTAPSFMPPEQQESPPPSPNHLIHHSPPSSQQKTV